MNGINKAILLGTVGKDAEVKYLDGGGTVASFTIATNGAFKKKDGTKETYVDWHNVEVWGETAKFAGTYVKKGTNLYVEGEIKTDKYKDKDGKDAYRTKIKAFTINLIPNGGGKPAANGTEASAAPANNNAAAKATEKAHEYVGAAPVVSGNDAFGQDSDDDLPF